MVLDKQANNRAMRSDRGDKVQRNAAPSSYFGHDLFAIKMKLRSSTVIQRSSHGTKSSGSSTTKELICADVTGRPLNLHISDKRYSSVMSDVREKLRDDYDFNSSNINDDNNNFLDSLEGYGPDLRQVKAAAVCYESDLASDPKARLQLADVYLGQTRKKRIKLTDDCIIESQQSSSCHVPDTTSCRRCNHDYDPYQTPAARAHQRNALSSSATMTSLSEGRYLVQPRELMSLGELNGRKNTTADKHMPWFGVDVGGTLTKVVFFDPKEATKEELVTLKRIRRYLKSSKAYGSTGKRDAHLEMSNCVMNKREGSLHFIRFATSQMPDFLTMARDKKLAETIDRVCATGGGANKFEDDIRNNLGIRLNKTDELDAVIYGIHYIDKHNSERECYFLEDPLDDAKCVKVPYDFSQPYPYLVVNIGSGVSILAVYSSTSYSRVSGSSIGGGTFLGLCSLLTHCETFDEAIQLAEAGTSDKCNKKVEDIYGGDYTKFNLSGNTVASHFGHMHLKEKHKEVSRADLARALLEMVTTNIGSIAKENAEREAINRVVFIGNFLRVNQLSMKLLSYALNYWSKGAIKALFLEHEGYFGAVGCFVESTRGH